jgi:hypothetical protein
MTMSNELTAINYSNAVVIVIYFQNILQALFAMWISNLIQVYDMAAGDNPMCNLYTFFSV